MTATKYRKEERPTLLTANINQYCSLCEKKVKETDKALEVGAELVHYKCFNNL